MVRVSVLLSAGIPLYGMYNGCSHFSEHLSHIHNFLICDYLEVTPQQFFDSELHNLPLIDKATDLMKQLDDEDMLALISMLNRLALKRK